MILMQLALILSVTLENISDNPLNVNKIWLILI